MALRVEWRELFPVFPQVLPARSTFFSPTEVTSPMRVRPSFLFFAFILALTSATQAQNAGSPDPQPVPVPNNVVPTGSDPNDSGYTSQYLLNYDWTASDDNADNAL